jgi:outer membrane protein TolC
LIGAPSLTGAVLVNRFDPPRNIAALASLDHIALARRQDLRAATYAEIVAKRGVSAAVAEYFPTVSVNFNTFLYKESFPSDSWWSGLFSVNFPIFEGGMIYQDIRKSYSQLRQASLERHLLARHILEEVRIARQNWITGNSLVHNLYTEWLSAKAAYAQAQHSFEVGLATNLDVITAQDSALSARLAYEKARYSKRVNMLNLLRTTGRLTWPAVHELAMAEAVTRH